MGRAVTMSKNKNNKKQFTALVILSLICMFPIIWVFLSSFKQQTELFNFPLTLFPKNWTLENYRNALSQGNFVLYFSNTAIVAVVSTVIAVAINIMAGYALAKYKFKGRDAIFYTMIATLMIPLQVIMIPIFIQLKNLGMLNSLWGIIIPPAATPTGVFLARQYMVNLPDSMIESARIDGAKEFFIFKNIIVPLSKPIIATIAIFSFMWRWNDFLWPLIVITDNRKQTIQQALANFVGQLQINWSDLLAMTTISIIPVILVFLKFQKYFMSGITSGAVKG
jgi:alpha-1,4-digalacturonate transport system permease protein